MRLRATNKGQAGRKQKPKQAGQEIASQVVAGYTITNTVGISEIPIKTQLKMGYASYPLWLLTSLEKFSQGEHWVFGKTY